MDAADTTQNPRRLLGQDADGGGVVSLHVGRQQKARPRGCRLGRRVDGRAGEGSHRERNAGCDRARQSRVQVCPVTNEPCAPAARSSTGRRRDGCPRPRLRVGRWCHVLAYLHGRARFVRVRCL
ncbi:hypothetical protein F5B18DRAFT_630581 [Nemania serpens]|nr:hypothetical protein F5B18DRAFT_630581 [Nemania serpens]